MDFKDIIGMYAMLQKVIERTALDVREIRLTKEQLDAISEVCEQHTRETGLPYYFPPGFIPSAQASLFGIPVRIVDSVFESTPFELAIDRMIKEAFPWRR